MNIEDETNWLYGDQSFERLRDNNAFIVYYIHISMLEYQLEEVINTPVSYDIFTRLGYVDHKRAYDIQKAIKHFRKLIAQAKERL